MDYGMPGYKRIGIGDVGFANQWQNTPSKKTGAHAVRTLQKVKTGRFGECKIAGYELILNCVIYDPANFERGDMRPKGGRWGNLRHQNT